MSLKIKEADRLADLAKFRRNCFAPSRLALKVGTDVEDWDLFVGVRMVHQINGFFVVAHLARVPHSLSQTLAAALLGIAAARHAAVDPRFVRTMLAVWLGAPVASIALIGLLMRLSRRMINERHVWATTRNIKVVLVGLSFLAAFALGGNTIGFVYAAIPDDPRHLLLALAAILAGSILFSAGELRRIGYEIVPMRYINAIAAQSSAIVLIVLATLFGMPLSYTVVFTAGVYGAGFSYQHRLLKAGAARTIAYSWLAMLLAGFLLGYAGSALLGRRA